MAKLYGPLRYIGGKFYLAPWHVSLFSPHDLFVTHFAGGLSEIFAKPLGNEIANDNSEVVVNFWKVLRDYRDEFIQRCLLTPLSRSLVEELREMKISLDPVEKAWQFYTLNRQAFSGTGTGNKPPSWSISGRIRRGVNESASAWMSSVDRLGEIADRIRSVALECADFETTIARFDGTSVMHYCDPPYYLSDEPNEYYEYSFTRGDHMRLACRLKNVKGKVMVCNYDSQFYRDLYQGWRIETQSTTIHASGDGVKGQKVEAVFLNY